MEECMKKIKIVTFNIRCPYYGDGINSFIHRAGIVFDKIQEEKPHVICFQEVGDAIRCFLKRHLVDYELVGIGRNADYTGESLMVAFRRDEMELFALEHFWLSPTPFVPGSRFENQSDCPRICTEVILKHQNAKTPMRFYNVHLDHMSDEARILGIRQILDKVQKDLEGFHYPFAILGDFNAEPDSKTIEFMNDNPIKVIDVTKEIQSTFHDFGKYHNHKIDYIYFDQKTAEKACNVCIWDDVQNGIYLSDHYPISCEIEME